MSFISNSRYPINMIFPYWEINSKRLFFKNDNFNNSNEKSKEARDENIYPYVNYRLFGAKRYSKMIEVIPNKIREARLRRQVSQLDAAKTCNKTVAWVSHIERTGKLKLGDFKSIMEVYDLPQKYYHEEDDDISRYSGEIAKKYTLRKKTVEIILIYLRDHYKVWKEISDLKSDFLSDYNIKTPLTPDEFRNEQCLGDKPLLDITAISMNCGIFVDFINIDGEENNSFKSIYANIAGKHLIAVNSSLDAFQRRYALSKALMECFNPGITKQKAELYARALLLPDQAITEYFENLNKVILTNIQELSWRFGVTPKNVILRLHEKGVISNRALQSWKLKISQWTCCKNEIWQKVWQEENHLFNTAIKEALSLKLFSINRLTELFSLLKLE